MRLNIDLKSVIIGVVLTGILVVAMGATYHPARPCGRYQLTLSDDYAYIIDTENGRVWQKRIGSFTSNSESVKRFFASK